MATRMEQRRGDAAEWAALNPVLGDGEIGFERDTGRLKIGNGTTPWNSLVSPYLDRFIFDAAGDLIIGTGPDTAARLPKGTSGQRLTILPDGTVAWADLPAEDNPLVVIDALGDLIVGTGPDTAARLPRGATGQRLTVNADGTLGWINMPDLSGFETSAHAAATYLTPAQANAAYESLTAAALEETQSHAAATYETLVHAAATYETQAHATATYRPIAANAYAEKSADTSRTNATPSNDPHLSFGIDANAVWIFNALLLVDGDTADINIGINGPAASDVVFAGAGNHNANTSGSNGTGEWVGRTGAPLAVYIPFATVLGSRLAIHLRGRIKTGANPGFCTINWSQRVTNATATTLVAGSFLEGHRVI